MSRSQHGIRRYNPGSENGSIHMMSGKPLIAAAIGHPILGYIIPAAIFIVSFWVAWACYKHFSKKHD